MNRKVKVKKTTGGDLHCEQFIPIQGSSHLQAYTVPCCTHVPCRQGDVSQIDVSTVMFGHVLLIVLVTMVLFGQTETNCLISFSKQDQLRLANYLLKVWDMFNGSMRDQQLNVMTMST